MSFWTAGLNTLAWFNPVTALGKGVYDIYAKVKDTNVQQDAPFYASVPFLANPATSTINAISGNIGGISQGLTNFGSALNTNIERAASTFETAAKSSTIIALVGGAVALYYLYKK
jgi:beta-lactamase regulating signal transducer with metallopeptidase domain